MLTIKQVAERLNVSASIVYGWVATGLLAAYRLGAAGRRGCIRIAEADLNALLESLKTKTGQKAGKALAPQRVFKHVKIPGG
jgi:excisionase family DNA binding protein